MRDWRIRSVEVGDGLQGLEEDFSDREGRVGAVPRREIVVEGRVAQFSEEEKLLALGRGETLACDETV